ncbi:MAG: guanylate kinase [Microcystaceae cyanobacterium]
MVITGPSGVGKGTLVKALIARHPQLHLSISVTTRAPRPGEEDGKSYHLGSRPHFQSLIEQDALLEWAEYAGNQYGTPRTQVEQLIAQGKTVLLEIEVVGARKISQTFPTAFRIFILPPSVAELERRLRDRNQDSPEAIARRLEKGEEEIAVSDEFDCQIVNDDFSTTLAQLEQVIVGNPALPSP